WWHALLVPSAPPCGPCNKSQHGCYILHRFSLVRLLPSLHEQQASTSTDPTVALTGPGADARSSRTHGTSLPRSPTLLTSRRPGFCTASQQPGGSLLARTRREARRFGSLSGARAACPSPRRSL